MATAGIVNTKLLKLQYADAPNTPVTVTCLTNAELSISNEMFDTTCKDSGQFKEVIPGQTSGTLSGEAFVAYDSANGHDEVATDVLSQAKLEWVFGTGVSGDTKFSGQGYFSSFSVSSPGQNEGASFSFEVTCTGTITKGTFS